MRLLIIGATGGTGLQVTSQAVEGGDNVTAFARSPQKLGSLPDRSRIRRLRDRPRSVPRCHRPSKAARTGLAIGGLADRDSRPPTSRPTPPAKPENVLGGGRTWWAPFEFTRINIEPIILRKKIEDWREVSAFTALARRISRKRISPSGQRTAGSF